MATKCIPPHRAAALRKEAYTRLGPLVSEAETAHQLPSRTFSEHTADTLQATRTFAIVELAERIFLELPPRDILVNIQRTSKQFQAVVEGSTPIQQALFFKPITDVKLKWVNCTEDCNEQWGCGGE